MRILEAVKTYKEGLEIKRNYNPGNEPNSGGCARKRAAMSVTLTSVKRVQSSPNLLAADSAETYPQHTQSLDGSLGSSIPLYRSSEEEKRVTVIKAPHYPGIGPVDESGIPTAIRTTVDRPKDWYKTMFKQIHMVHKPGLYNSPYSAQSHPAAKTQTYRPLSKSHSDNGTDAFKDASSPVPPPHVPPPVPPLRPRDRSSTEKTSIPTPSPCTPALSPIWVSSFPLYRSKCRQEVQALQVPTPEPTAQRVQARTPGPRRTDRINPDDIDLENEPWYKFFSELEFGRPGYKEKEKEGNPMDLDFWSCY
ncbi:hypothetical protein CB1_000362016 [Camelus ferus]|nr:hypothetical protein CB1_000362016 [Camelus ferus]